jgi:D-psicose/D-tagatose/L-ribulose 3-epimerase
MMLAVSNIAWSGALEEEALKTLQSLGITRLEIAPTRLWPKWGGMSLPAAHQEREQYKLRGFQIPSLQAILFEKPHCKLFGTDGERQALGEHLNSCADLASALGATSLVFGAPKNRDLNGLSSEAAVAIAQDVFAAAGSYYHFKGVVLCMEANPVQYACTFVTNSVEAAALVRLVNSPGFRLHLDTACLFLAEEDICAAIEKNFDILQHFHVSEPNLGDFASPVIDHHRVADCLRGLGYEQVVSLEMREAPATIPALRQAVRYLTSTYGFGS